MKSSRDADVGILRRAVAREIVAEHVAHTLARRHEGRQGRPAVHEEVAPTYGQDAGHMSHRYHVGCHKN